MSPKPSGWTLLLLLPLSGCSADAKGLTGNEPLTSLTETELVSLCRTTSESEEYLSAFCEMSAVLLSAEQSTTDESFANACEEHRRECDRGPVVCSELSPDDLQASCEATVADWEDCSTETIRAMRAAGVCTDPLATVKVAPRPDGMSPSCMLLLACSPSMVEAMSVE